MIETVPGVLRAAAEKWGGKAALVSVDNEAVTFDQLDRGVDRFAAACLADGMNIGERVAIWAPNCWEWVAAAVGAQRAGGTLVPLNTRLRGAEVADLLRRARVSRLVTAGTWRGVDLPQMLEGQDFPELRRIVIVNPGRRTMRPGETEWDAFLALGDGISQARLATREALVDGNTVADILFTSGTTGRPKGAMFRHASTVRSGYGMINFARLCERDCHSPLGTFAHHAAYKGGWLTGLVSGASVCWNDAHDATTLLGAIERLRISVMAAPPIVWQNILNHPQRASHDLSSLRFAATGSTLIPPLLVRRLMAELEVEQVGTGYGLTESGGLTNFSRPDDPVECVVNTTGRQGPDAEVRIAPLTAGCREGEILVRTDRAMLGYLDDEEASRAALVEDGWLRTGDVGWIDEGGYLRVTDRLKDMYIYNGFNVYPAEVERMMQAMPGIDQCAVIGIPDSSAGERGHAFIVRNELARLDENQITEWCRANMARYKVPSGISFVDELPRNLQGKVLKRELAAWLSQDHSGSAKSG